MRITLSALAALLLMSSYASAGRRINTASDMAPPQVWTHEPGPNDRLDRFQVILVNDGSCPAGQIKKFTAGSKQLGVRSSKECVSR